MIKTDNYFRQVSNVRPIDIRRKVLEEIEKNGMIILSEIDDSIIAGYNVIKS